jgi:hypothetical protein
MVPLEQQLKQQLGCKHHRWQQQHSRKCHKYEQH